MAHRTVLQYELLERIGVGGMGEIYKARDTRLNRFVAIKALSAGMAADPDRRLRFIQEAQAVSALNHPNIITIYDIVEDGPTRYMVVEYVDGKTLLELIPKGGLPVPQVLRYALQIAEALCAAHAAGIIHRDLKPANVMVTGTGLVKVLDFGLAKLIDWKTADPEGPTLTMAPAPLTVEGTLLGTVNYMSPEQAEGKKLDARSDVFSFGAVLYEMLTGQNAFRGESVVATLTAVLRDDIQPIGDLAYDVPPALQGIVVQCLKKNPAERIQSMQEIQSALARLRQQSDSAALSNVPAAALNPPPPARRSRLPLVFATVIVLVLVAAGVGFRMTTHRTAPPPTIQHSAATLANNDIIALTAARFSPGQIISKIRNSRTNFNLSAAEVVRLSKAGVSPAVIEAMRTPESAAPAPTPPPPPPTPVTVTLTDGQPVLLTLAADIPADVAAGTPVDFKVAADVSLDEAVVIHKGATATGVIADAPKHVLGIGGGKLTFRLSQVEAVDGRELPLRVTADAAGAASKRPVETGAKVPKTIAASAGTPYTGYIDGTQTVTVKK